MANNDLIAQMVGTSISTIISTVTNSVVSFVKTRFPDNYIKSTIINTTMCSVQLERKDIIKRGNPIMTVATLYDPNADTTLGNLSGWFMNYTSIPKKFYGEYPTVFFDEENGYYIYAMLDRVKFNFEFKIRLNGHLQAIDACNNLLYRMPFEKPFFVNNVSMETPVPQTLLKAILVDKGVDISKPEEVDSFYEHLNRFSNGSLTRKVHLASNRNLYFYKYRTNLLCKCDSKPSVDYEPKNMALGNSVISFQMSTELWVPYKFILQTRKPIVLEEPPLTEGEIISYITLDQPVFGPAVDNYRLVFWREYITDSNVLVDILPMAETFSDELKTVISHNLSNGIDNSEFFKIVVFWNKEKKVEGTDFTFNWRTLELNTINPLYNMSYFVAVYADPVKVRGTLLNLGILEE
jgi:hypothetical protein